MMKGMQKFFDSKDFQQELCQISEESGQKQKDNKILLMGLMNGINLQISKLQQPLNNSNNNIKKLMTRMMQLESKGR